MLYKIGELYDVPVFETPVGFKYVAPVMMKENALLGGEESRGYGSAAIYLKETQCWPACTCSIMW